MSDKTIQPHAVRRRRRLPLILGIILAVVIAAVVVSQLVMRGGGGSSLASAEEPDSTKAEAEGSEGAENDAKDDKNAKNGKDAKEEEERVPIEVDPVIRGDVPAFFTGTAVLEAENEAEIIARTSGNVVAIHVEEGDRVRRDALLLELDGREQEIAFQEARASAENLRHELDRLQALFQRDLTSERELVGARSQFEAAEARQNAAELNVAFTRVQSPFDGVVTQRYVGVGQPVNPGTPLFVVADLKPLLVRVFMPERVIQRTAIGQEVRIESDADPGVAYRGRVARIAPVVDRRTGTVKVTVELDNAREESLMPGAFVRVFIETDRHLDALTVPERAIVEEGGESFVFRAEADSVRRVRVEPGYVYEGMVEVLTGLKEGEQVVTAGQGALKDGAKIRIIESNDQEE